MKNRTILTAIIALLIVALTAAIALGDENAGLTYTNVLVNGKDVSATGSVVVKPMQTVDVTFKVKNTLNEKITKITNSIIDEAGYDYDFAIGNQTQFHLEAGAESPVQKITVTPSAEVPEGKYTFALISQGFTLDDNAVRQKQEFSFTVKREKAEIVVKLDPLSKNTLTCSAGATLTATFTNTGTVAEDDVLARILDGSVEVYHSEKANVDLRLEVGESKTITIPVTVNTEGQHTLTLETGFNYINNVPGSMANSQSVVMTKQPCLSSSINPTNTDLKVLDGALMSFSVSTNEENFGSSVIWTIDGTQKGNGKTFTHTFTQAGVFTVKAALGGEAKTWKVTVADRPLDLTSFGWTQSQIDQISNPSSVANFVLTTTEGSITYTQPVDISNLLTLSDVVKIGSQFVAVDSVKAPGLHKPATILLKNVDGKGLVKLYKYDGFGDAAAVDKAVLCPDTACTIASQQPSGFTFCVTGFSTYIAVAQKTAELTVPTEIVINDPKTSSNSTLTATFTVQNTGTTESVKNIIFELSDFSSSLNTKILNAPSTLAPQESKTVTVQVDSSKSSVSGKKLVGTIKISSDKGAKSIPVYISSKSFLVIESVKINDKTSGSFSLVEEENTVEVKLRNDYSEKMEDVYVNVQILDVDGSDLEEESETIELRSSGNDDTIEVSFDLRAENIDKKQYTLEITAYGKADDGTKHETTTTQIVDVDVKSHEIIVKKAALLNGNALCGQQYETLSVEIKNIGSNDEDNVEIRVKNSALNVDLAKKNIDLEKFSDSDSEFETSFTLDIQKAAAGSYPITIEVYRDGSLQTTSTVTLTVQNCAATGATVLGSGNQGQDALAQQLQQQLNTRTTSNQPAVTSSLRDNNNYVLLLGGLVVLVFVALVLAMALVWKKR